MALSGSKTVNFCSRGGSNRYYIQISWSATQNISANTSSVTVKLYLGSHGNGYGMNASATKSGAVWINGTKYAFTTAGISLASGGKKQLFSKTVTISHNSDGTKSFNISGWYNPAVTISGTYQGTAETGTLACTLNQIPRASSFSNTAEWKFPNNKTISISKKSSSFTSTVRIYVGGTLIKTWTKTSSTSFSTNFTTAENTTIAGKFAQGSSATVRMELDTYSGNTKIGSTATISGTLSIYGRSTTTFTNNWNIGSTISGKITENASAYTHTIQLLQSNASTVICTIMNKGTALNWSYTPTASTLYALTPNSNSYTGRIRIYTYYNGVQIGSYAQSNITFKVANSNPTFAPTLSYYDSNATTTAVTGNDDYIIQNKSQLIIEAYGQATARNSATLSKVTCTVAGVTKTGTWNSTAGCYSFNFGTINASSNQSAVVKAIDSRGNSTSKSLVVTCIPYTAPKLVATAERANKFSTTVNIDVGGTFSGLPVAGTNMNAIQSCNYTTAIDGGATSAGVPITLVTAGTSYTTTSMATFTLSETSIATVVVRVTDRLGGTATASISVPTGLPIMFIDAERGNISFNALPDMTKESNMKIGMSIDAAKNQYWLNSSTYEVVGDYGLHMNNSAIVGGQSFIFGDICDVAHIDEGILFPNKNSPTSGQDYSRLYVRDGLVWVGTGNSTGGTTLQDPVCIGNAKQTTPIFTGGHFCNADFDITLPNIVNTQLGWVFVFSDYDATGDSIGAKNWNFQAFVVPKWYVRAHSGNSFYFDIVAGHTASTGTTLWAYKMLYIHTTRVVGHNDNGVAQGNQRDVCLRYIYAI